MVMGSFLVGWAAILLRQNATGGKTAVSRLVPGVFSLAATRTLGFGPSSARGTNQSPAALTGHTAFTGYPMLRRQVLLIGTVVAALSAQDSRATPVPFRVGEQLVYDLRLKLGMVGLGRVGTGRMIVAGVETVRGRPAYHLIFAVQGGTIGFRVDDRYESWVDTVTCASLRHTQRIREGGYHRNTSYEMFPERSTYAKNGGDEQRSVSLPLDDGSFIYYVRALALDAGERREVARYFKPAQNPVVLVASRRDSVNVPAGRFDAVVVQPTIPAVGLFAAGGRAEMWMSRDARQLMVRMVTHVSFGTLELTLRSIQEGPPVLVAQSRPIGDR
jgi:hypothetical protein